MWLKGCAVLIVILLIAVFKFDYQVRVWATVGIIALMAFAVTQKNKR